MSKILFIDYDGTLHDTDAKFAAKLDGVYGLTSQQVMDVYITVHRRIVHRRYPEKHDDFFFHQKLISDHLNLPYDKAEARRIADIFEEAQEERWTNPSFFPDSLYFLDKTREHHILCLTTGDYAREKADALENAAGKCFFSYAFDHNNLGIKDGGTFFKNALRSTNSLAEDAVVIGDSLEQDIAAAKEAGIIAIWVDRKGLTTERISPNPDYRAKDLLEVLEYIDGF